MKSFFSKVFCISLVAITAGCTHSISHSPLRSTLPAAQNERSILIVMPTESRNFTGSHSNLSGDKWIFHVGAALADIAPQVFRNQYGSVALTDTIPANFTPSAQNQLVVLNIQSFVVDIGWTIFSRHDGKLTLSVDARGKRNVSQTVSGSGSDSSGSYGKTYGALLLPTVGISGYNEAMAVMISNAATSASAAAMQVADQSAQ